MNWDALGAIGELIGSLAVLLTLIYLAVQVSHARSELRQSIRQSRFSTYREVFTEPLRNLELLKAICKAEEILTNKIEEITELEAELSLEQARLLRIYQASDWMYRIETTENLDHLGEYQRSSFKANTARIYSKGYAQLWHKDYLESQKLNGFPTQGANQYLTDIINKG